MPRIDSNPILGVPVISLSDHLLTHGKAALKLLALFIVVALAPLVAPAQAAAPAVAHEVSSRAKPPAKKPKPLGIATGSGILYESVEVQRRYFAAVKRLGIKRIRTDLAWSSVEHAGPGQYDWARHDRLFAEARRQGLHIMAIVGYEPSWAKQYDETGRKLPPNPQLFARFVNQASKRYASQVAVWELWNEPNLAPYWGSQPNGSEYGRVVRPALTVLRRTDPHSKLLVGGMAPGQNIEGQQHPLDFLRGIYATVPRGLFDGVSIHPYTYPTSPHGEEEWNTFHRLGALRAFMVEKRDGKKKLWLTEYGAPTGTGEGAVTEAQQAKLIMEGIREAQSRSYVSSTYLYSLRDTGNDASDREQRFGLLRYDWSEKPAYGRVQSYLR